MGSRCWPSAASTSTPTAASISSWSSCWSPRASGALQIAFEQLKRKLEAEGLFDPARKRPLPPFPRTIGIVTSRTGAALRDMLHVIGRRFADLRVLVAPVRVQGEEAPREIVAAIADLCEVPDLDVVIVGRGGGSIEDLWAFNDERVARAIAGCRVPVISAVGHETDFTIADFVADLRAPTPSGAAELVVREKLQVVRALGELYARLGQAMRAHVGARAGTRALPRSAPRADRAGPRAPRVASTGGRPRASAARGRARAPPPRRLTASRSRQTP